MDFITRLWGNSTQDARGRRSRVLRRTVRILLGACLTTLLVISSSMAPAFAAENPGVWKPSDPVPADGTPRSTDADGKSVPMQQRKTCATSAVLPDSQFSSIPAMSPGVFDVKGLHRFSKGAGVKVGVIDSGVNPNARLPRLEGGGDYITDTNGLFDCDQHGTLVAGLIAGAPGDKDSFVGVAPDATIVSVRQTSGAYSKVNYNDAPPSSLDLLAKAIVHLANMGVKVINMSVTACEKPGTAIADMAKLRGAIRYASVVKDVVLVTPAGNVSGGDCQQNPLPDPNKHDDPQGWKSLKTWSIPSIVSDGILSVGGSTLEGDAYVNTLWGPWVDVSAPAMNIISLDPEGRERGGLVNAELTQDGTSPKSGTSFASALIAGLAALIRSVNPSLTATEVRNLITNSVRRTAGTLNPVFGQGHVDPVRALTGAVRTANPVPRDVPADKAPAELIRPPHIDRARVVGIAVMVAGGIAVVCMAVFAYLAASTKEPAVESGKVDDDEDDDEEETP